MSYFDNLAQTGDFAGQQDERTERLKKLGAILRSEREKRHFNLRDLGKRLSYSITALSSYERGLRLPSDRVITQYIDVFHLDPLIAGQLREIKVKIDELDKSISNKLTEDDAISPLMVYFSTNVFPDKLKEVTIDSLDNIASQIEETIVRALDQQFPDGKVTINSVKVEYKPPKKKKESKSSGGNATSATLY